MLSFHTVSIPDELSKRIIIPKAASTKMASTVTANVIALGKNCTKNTQIKPITNANSKLNKIESKVSKKIHF